MHPRIGAYCAYTIAILSIAYAAIFVTTGQAIASSPLANALLAASGILATAATVAVADQLPDRPGRWVRIVGVTWALLSAAHAAQSGIAAVERLTIAPINATDPRGFATFALAGIWTLVVGLAIRGGGTPFPRTLGLLAIVSGLDLIALYAATLAGIGALAQVSALLAAVILGPAYWAWTGRVLSRAV